MSFVIAVPDRMITESNLHKQLKQLLRAYNCPCTNNCEKLVDNNRLTLANSCASDIGKLLFVDKFRERDFRHFC